jgi:hypothetical protein
MKQRKKSKVKDTTNTHQSGRQQGSQTGGEAYKSNSQSFHRHPGQGMRGKQGGQREAAREAGQESTGSDTRKKSRPRSER